MFDIFNMLKKNEENKTMQVTRETIIGDILDMDQTTAPYFMEIGMHCLGCPASRGETIAEACEVHGVDCDELLEKLNAHLASKKAGVLPTLDARLTAAAELVLPGKPVADIGCDHGKLTAVLAASGKYPRVIGADLRPGPLAKAEQTLEHAGCKDRVELRLGDGLSVLSAGEVGTIVLAGVSAQTTWEIIEQAPWVSQVGGPRLVMVPATRHGELRRWLWEHGFALAADRPVQAAGRWYAVMAAEYTGEVRTPTFTECLFGRTAEWPEGAGYAAWQKAKLPRFRLGVPDGTELAEEIDKLLDGSPSQTR